MWLTSKRSKANVYGICIAHHREASLMCYRFPYVGADLCKLAYSQESANTERPCLWGNVSCDMPVYLLPHLCEKMKLWQMIFTEDIWYKNGCRTNTCKESSEWLCMQSEGTKTQWKAYFFLLKTIPLAMYTAVCIRHLRRRHTLATSTSGCPLLQFPHSTNTNIKQK